MPPPSFNLESQLALLDKAKSQGLRYYEDGSKICYDEMKRNIAPERFLYQKGDRISFVFKSPENNEFIKMVRLYRIKVLGTERIRSRKDDKLRSAIQCNMES